MTTNRLLGLSLVATSAACTSVPMRVEHYVATDHQEFVQPHEGRTLALRASGAHDLGCPFESVTRPLNGRDMVEGCGKRATYSYGVDQREHLVYIQFVLTSVVPLAPPPGMSAQPGPPVQL
jgi:hypothetical protein